MLDKKALAEVIEACRQSDRFAQNRLYRAFYAWAFSICQRYAGDLENTRECVQDGFFKVFTKIDQYKGEQAFEGWLKKIMINTAIDRYRSTLNEKPNVTLEVVADQTLVAEYLINADAEHLLFLVRQLPPAYQVTFNLYAVEGYEYQEIADLLGVSIGSVKSNLSKARAVLKKMLLASSTEEVYGR